MERRQQQQQLGEGGGCHTPSRCPPPNFLLPDVPPAAGTAFTRGAPVAPCPAERVPAQAAPDQAQGWGWGSGSGSGLGSGSGSGRAGVGLRLGLGLGLGLG